MKKLRGKHLLIFGGTGFIGSAIVKQLSRLGALSHLSVREKSIGILLCREIWGEMADGKNDHSGGFAVVHDTTDLDLQSMLILDGQEPELRGRSINIEINGPQTDFDGLVYCVGNGGSRGNTLEMEVGTPLSEHTIAKLAEEFSLHVLGLHYAMTTYLSHMRQGANIVVIGSAINRLLDGIVPMPPFLKAGHYGVAKGAQELYIRWLRLDEHIREKEILVHHLRLGAVDSPFHHGSPEHMQPRAMLDVNYVAQKVCEALTFEPYQNPIDANITPD